MRLVTEIVPSITDIDLIISLSGINDIYNYDSFQSELAARDFISNHQSLFRITDENLELWVNELHGNLRYLIFNQIYENIPVWNARLDFRYRLNGDLVMIGHDAYPDLYININPTLDEEEVILISQLHIYQSNKEKS